MRCLRNVAILGLLVAVAGCARSSGPTEVGQATADELPISKKVASTDVVKVSPTPIEIPAGGEGETVLRLTIQTGYHLNANPPTYPYLIATELEIPPANGVSVGFITYPDPIKQKFEFAEEPLAVYEGETDLKIFLQIDKSATKGPLNLAGQLRVQACDDQVCYPPGTLSVTIPVTIK